jgi:hypothetical protein
MKSKYYKWIVRGLLLVFLIPLVLCVWAMLEPWARSVLLPSATEELLDFAELPRDTQLPRQDPKAAAGTDFHQVEENLLQRFPVGTPKQEVEQFVKKRCRINAGSIDCFFSNKTYPSYSSFVPCIDDVILIFSFDASAKLGGIKIVGSTSCM